MLKKMRLPRHLPAMAFFVVLGTCGVQIARSATAPPVTQPVERDVTKANRTAATPSGGTDQRATLPERGGDRVGGNGVVEPAHRETRLAAQVTATVRRVLVKEGDWVEPGAVLVELDDGVEAAAVQAAEADLQAERATVVRTLRGLRAEERDAVAAESQAAKASAELAQRVLARTEQLAASGAAAPEELERARSQAQSSRAQFQATEARLRAAEAGTAREDIAVARARRASAEGRLAQARAALERLTIRAPAAAEVLQIKVREGELYSSQSAEPLLIVGDTKQLKVRMDVDERDIARVRSGAPAYVMAAAFGDRKFTGRVAEVGRRFGRKNVRTDDPVEKNDTKVLEVVIELDSSDLLVPGQRVTSFVTASPEDGLAWR